MKVKKWAVDTVIFDFDGVIADSSRDITNAANFMLRKLGIEELPVSLVSSYIGGGMETLLRKCLGDRTGELRDAALPVFKKRYASHFCIETVLYPGVNEVLESFMAMGKNMAIATNKLESLTQSILEILGIKKYFQFVVGPESVTRRKPDPECIQIIIDRTNTPAEKTLMIGDTAADIEAGRNAGTVTCGVTYGFGTVEDIKQSKPDILVSQITKSLDHIK